MTCPKCGGEMIVKQRVNADVTGLETKRHECSCGWTVEDCKDGFFKDGYWKQDRE